ncbi:hypothetical protein [Sulfitobacter sp. NFXS29]|mgnify:FL=1|uniref:hypothetical protein n=1 Tax=Sulfitobacter sp. NFXS29 TaxID=2818438 RepID=UPI0032DF4F23
MSEMSDRHAAMRADIKLILLTDPTPAGWVYVDLEGINPRILAHVEDKATFSAYAERFLAILQALYGEFRADRTQPMRSMKFQYNTAAFSEEPRAAARPALYARLAEVGCSDEEIKQLVALR